MTRKEYLKLRTKTYKFASEIGHMAEMSQKAMLASAYRAACRACDDIDVLGEDLGIIDPETNNVIKPVKKTKV
jgi:hypothetical protein